MNKDNQLRAGPTFTQLTFSWINNVCFATTQWWNWAQSSLLAILFFFFSGWILTAGSKASVIAHCFIQSFWRKKNKEEINGCRTMQTQNKPNWSQSVSPKMSNSWWYDFMAPFYHLYSFNIMCFIWWVEIFPQEIWDKFPVQINIKVQIHVEKTGLSHCWVFLTSVTVTRNHLNWCQ